MIQNGVDLYTIARILGHRDIKTTTRYAHHYPESLRSSLEKLSVFYPVKKVEKEAVSG